MGNQKKFSSYDNLSVALRRSGFTSGNKVASLLLECFMYNGGDLKASAVVERGLCEEGGFKAWRDDLIKKGWLNYSVGEYSKHSPGAKLIKYINKEKMSKHELATMGDVNKVDSKVSALEKEVQVLKKVVTQMIEEFDPPATPDKIEKRLTVVKG